MMAQRAILSRPHMQNLADNPAVELLHDAELVELDALFAFLYEKELGMPTEKDLQSFATLCDKGEKELMDLYEALKVLLAGEDTLGALLKIISKIPKPTIPRTTPRPPPIARYISVAPEELPDEWQRHLRKMRFNEEYSPEILKRTEQKLCEFVFLARKQNLPIDLANIQVLNAYCEDVTRRSKEKNDDRERIATLRASFEELRRFGASIGLPEEAVSILKRFETKLADEERLQPALKLVKNTETASLQEIMWLGRDLLEQAERIENRRHRHLRRCHATALVLGCVVPARRTDVFTHHIFGQGLFWEPENDAYRFHYTPEKTKDTIKRPFDMLLDPEWNVFIDALILQDHDRRYLNDLREKAIAENRPLYVNQKGEPLSINWFSSVWAKHIGTGSHIARTKVYDTMRAMGAVGLQVAKAMNHHVSSRTVEKYRSIETSKAMIAQAQNALIELFPIGSSTQDLSD